MMLKKLLAMPLLIVSGMMIVAPSCRAQGEYLSGIKWPEPAIITPGKTAADPPSDAIILFDGKDIIGVRPHRIAAAAVVKNFHEFRVVSVSTASINPSSSAAKALGRGRSPRTPDAKNPKPRGGGKKWL